MRIAILSDTHDHIGNLEKVIFQIQGKVDAVFHLGDWCAPFNPPFLARLNVPVYACFGNNDEDQGGLIKNSGNQFTPLPERNNRAATDEQHSISQENVGHRHGHDPLVTGFTWIPLWQEFGTAELGGRKIAFCHFPRLGELLAGTGEYDAVFHGHTHFSRNETVGTTLLLNPGAVCGIQKGKYGMASFGIYDTETNKAEVIKL